SEREGLSVRRNLPEVTITYFQPDERKTGGAYVSVSGVLKKIDDYERSLVMADGTRIPMDRILEMDGENL
ncbi:MAG: hypothetical protein Q4C60_11980, partial [Eubacteriales bacterium]|nr:hypothetical protein [Eubacteriales bacterium]